jgi:enamine deaminase RidA (YjgF/YER057c/UK114 family)
MATGAEERIRELKLVLPTPAKPMAKYRTALLIDKMLYVSGHGPLRADGSYIQGKVGSDLTTAQGKEAARATGLAILSTARQALGSLDRLHQLVKTIGLVNCNADFREHPQVINGFSELMAEVLGDDLGVGVRSAIGAVSLPANIAVEIECAFTTR